MSRSKIFVAASLVLIGLLPLGLRAQSAPASGPHLVIVKLVQTNGAMPFAFQPANPVVQQGDTLRFVEASGTMHNVRFTRQAAGAKLGAAATSPFLTAKGQTYDLVIDQRFAVGKYEFVCDPHEPIGMKGTLVVSPAAQTTAAR